MSSPRLDYVLHVGHAGAPPVAARMRQGAFTQGLQYPASTRRNTTPSSMVRRSSQEDEGEVELLSELNEWNWVQQFSGTEGTLSANTYYIPMLISNAVLYTYNPWFENSERQLRLPAPADVDTQNGVLKSGRDVRTRLPEGAVEVEKHPNLDAARAKARICYVLDGSNMFYYKEKEDEHYMLDRTQAMDNALAQAREAFNSLPRAKKAAFPKLESGEADLRGNIVVVSSLDTLDYTFNGKYFDPQPNDYLHETRTDGREVESVMGFREMLVYRRLERIRAPGTLVSWSGIQINPVYLTNQFERGYDDFLSRATADFMRRSKQYDIVIMVSGDAFRDSTRVATATINMLRREDVVRNTEVQFYVFHESRWLLESHKDSLIDGPLTAPQTPRRSELDQRMTRWRLRGDKVPEWYTNRYDVGP